jgi:hypothetical protein
LKVEEGQVQVGKKTTVLAECNIGQVLEISMSKDLNEKFATQLNQTEFLIEVIRILITFKPTKCDTLGGDVVAQNSKLQQNSSRAPY